MRLAAGHLDPTPTCMAYHHPPLAAVREAGCRTPGSHPPPPPLLHLHSTSWAPHAVDSQGTTKLRLGLPLHSRSHIQRQVEELQGRLEQVGTEQLLQEQAEMCCSQERLLSTMADKAKLTLAWPLSVTGCSFGNATS